MIDHTGSDHTEDQDSYVTIYYVLSWDEDDPSDMSKWTYKSAKISENIHINFPIYSAGDGRSVVAWTAQSPDSKTIYPVKQWFIAGADADENDIAIYYAVYEFDGHGKEENVQATAGKKYAEYAMEDNEIIYISGNSAFSVRFAIDNMDPSYYGERVLKFGKAPVAETTIAMIYNTTGQDLKYYYYVVTGNETVENGNTVISLSDFKLFGSTETFQPVDTLPDGVSLVNEDIVFVVTLGDSNLDVAVDNYMILERKSQDAAKDSSTQTLRYEMMKTRTFTISPSASNTGYIGDAFTLEYSSEAPDYDVNAEYRYDNRKLAIVLSSDDMPKDAVVTVGDKKYNLNSQGQIIIPLDAFAEDGGSGTLQFTFYSKSCIANGTDCMLTASLWASDNANGAKPMMGTKLAETYVSVVTRGTVSIGLTMKNRIFHADALPTSANVRLESENLEGSKVSWTVQKKDKNGIYVDTTEVTVSKDSTQSKCILLLGSATVGSYRAVCTVTDGTKVVTTEPIGFIIVS